MATRNVIGSGNWTNLAIWEGGILPTVGDDVVINIADTTLTVTLTSNVDISSLSNFETFQWNSGTLKVDNSFSNNAVLNISGSGYKYLEAQLNNTGTIIENHSSTYDLRLRNGAVINNSGTYELRNGEIINSGSIIPGIFNNSGTFKKTTFSNALVGVAFNNFQGNDTGTVTVEAGTLSLAGGGESRGGNFTVNSNSNLEFSGNNYLINQGSQITGSGNVNLSSGTLDLKVTEGVSIDDTIILNLTTATLETDDNWTLPTVTNWNEGTIKSSGIITNTGNLTIGGTNSKSLETQLNNTGTIIESHSHIYDLRLRNGAVINNSGTYELRNGEIINSGSIIPGVFNNSGTFKKTTFSNALVGVTFNNFQGNDTGTVTVEAGTLSLAGGGESRGGNFTVNSNSNLEFSGNNYLINQGSQITGSGNVNLSSGTLDLKITEGVSIDDTIILNLTAATLETDDNWTLPTVTNWNGGTLKSSGIITNTGDLIIEGNNTKYLEAQLNNTGIIVENHSHTYDLRLNNGAVINNSGTYELQNGEIRHSGAIIPGVFNNSGTFKKTTFSNALVGVTFNNFQGNDTGTVNVEAGTLSLTGGGESGGGNFTVNSNSNLRFSGSSNYLINQGSQLTGIGDVDIVGTLELKVTEGVSIDDAITVNLIDGILETDGNWTLPTITNWDGGTLKSSGIITNTGDLIIEGNNTKYLEAQLNNTGIIVENHSHTYDLRLNNGAVINNSGTYELQNGEIRHSGSIIPGVFNNSGTFKKSTFSNALVGVAFNNTGNLEAAAGTLNLTGNYTHNNGDIILKGGDINFSNDLNINAGSITGNGDINVDVINAGLLNPHYYNNTEFGQLILEGNYSETDSASIDLDIGGNVAGNNFDQIVINGNAEFDGTINVSVLNGFTPTLGDTFDVITYDSYTGNLDFTGLEIAENLTFIPIFEADKLTLVVGNTQPLANDDTVTTNADNSLTIAANTLLSNDTDNDGDPLEIIAIQSTETIGEVTLQGQQVIYNPNGQFDALVEGETATDTFEYTVSDPFYGIDTATVTVTINGVNDAPVAETDSFNMVRDTDLTIAIQDLLNNDSDPDPNDTIEFVGLGDAVNGSVSFNNNEIIFTPDFEFMGEASFEYVIQDSFGAESTGVVNVEIQPSNLGKLKGTLWNDANNNGIQDDGELGLNDWTVYLDDNRNGELDNGEISTTTDNQGNYTFDALQEGVYVVAQVLKEGWELTYPNEDTNSNAQTINTNNSNSDGGLFSINTSPQNLSNTDYTTGEIIVKLNAQASANELSTLQQDLGVNNIESLGDLGIELWTINNLTVEEAITQYSNHSAIQYIEPNYNISRENLGPSLITPTDPRYSELWGLNNTGQTGGKSDADINAPEAWEISKGSKSVIVGVIDTGVDYTHPDLIDNIWTNPGEIPNDGIDNDGNGYIDDVHGYDFFNNDGDPFDDHFHGTHVAGTIGATGDNGVGVTGVNWDVSIMPLKFLNSGGAGRASDAIRAINYATKMGVHLTNNSWGGSGYSQALYDAIAAAGEAGQLFVASAGNSQRNADQSPSYPAAYNLDNIISVAATDHNDNLAWFSNYGANSVDLGAPGVEILSTVPNNGYSSFNGTSMASPHVAGVAALIWANNPSLTAQEVKQIILESVDPLDNLTGITLTGGRLNAQKALQNSRTVPGTYAIRLEKGQILRDLDFGNYSINNPPIAVDDTAVTDEDTSVIINVLNNDSDVEGDSISLHSFDTINTQGILTDNGDGTITYDPNGQFELLEVGEIATDTFLYKIADDKEGVSEFATVTVTIEGVYDTPTPQSDRFESNNTRSNATSLSTTNGIIEENNLSIHNEQDIDWFSFNLDETGNSTHFARINFNNDIADLDIALYNSFGKLVDFSNGLTNQENISLDGLATGTYFLEVSGFDGAISPNYSLTINVPVSESISSNPPTDIILSNNTIDENQPQNTTIGSFSTLDPDTSETFTYNLVSGLGDTNNNLFTIDENTLKSNSIFDFENENTYSIRVQTTDSANNTYQEILTININDIDEIEREIVTGDNFILGEADTITLDHNLQTITLDHTYNNPIIFAPSVSYNGNQLATPRITNITNNSFDIYLQEPVNEDGTHILETLSYFVFEAGTYQLSDGTLVEVGSFDTDATANVQNLSLTPWQTVEFDIDFADTPVIFSQVQTLNDSNLVRTRQQNATANGFDVVLEEDEVYGRNAEGHSHETIGYVAIASGNGNSNGVSFQAGSTGNTVTHELFNINFGDQFTEIPHFLANIATYDGPDASALRFQNLTSNGVEVTVQEDITFDTETNHTTEVVNYLAVGGNNGWQGTAYDPLTGNRAIVGTDADEYILGIAENDTRTGQGGSDIFVLKSNQGTDTITDFELGVDSIGLSGGLSYNQLALDSLGENTLISYNNQALLVLNGVNSNHLTNNDFVEVTI